MKKFLLGLVFVFSLSAGGVLIAQTEFEDAGATDGSCNSGCFNGRFKKRSDGTQDCVWRGSACMR
ncbi:hypothetical protein Fleli_2941 [Bernardetia litoralis DSM 6794]|uniref:Uncharacterized protein n=1 Tax=Bernardetia litoralis (strain ATCC 23117 / DSM 6794 / NBRC 15988 / NCIMB 1366 / Fx l1 / Sio-4) TaxID=880071 RepID=I4AMV3_BERLS|nr:hypothetical protein [Bernardetia litoralis]AFM05288.1 hypothetical protein Fleli_2941 [Bernardetia litoralis DSM 6794]